LARFVQVGIDAGKNSRFNLRIAIAALRLSAT
jgi:hypothetical protein